MIKYGEIDNFNLEKELSDKLSRKQKQLNYVVGELLCFPPLNT